MSNKDSVFEFFVNLLLRLTFPFLIWTSKIEIWKFLNYFILFPYFHEIKSVPYLTVPPTTQKPTSQLMASVVGLKNINKNIYIYIYIYIYIHSYFYHLIWKILVHHQKVFFLLEKCTAIEVILFLFMMRHQINLKKNYNEIINSWTL
jgi:hypothetical protein